ncbi:MAG: hypothetical protein WBH57_10760 [Anaerolineae bacterium]
MKRTLWQGMSGVVTGSPERWRFILFTIVFNLLLISMVLLSLQQDELKTEVVVLQETRTLIEKRLITQEITYTYPVTIVVTPPPSNR